MFTVSVDCVGSGNSSTWRPLSSWYSVMPSTVRIFFAGAAFTGAGAAAGSALATTGAGLGAGAGEAGPEWSGADSLRPAGPTGSGFAPPHAASKRAGASTRRVMVLVDNMGTSARTRRSTWQLLAAAWRGSHHAHGAQRTA